MFLYTVTPGSNPTMEQPSSNTVNENLIMMMTLVMFPADVKCELAKVSNHNYVYLSC